MINKVTWDNIIDLKVFSGIEISIVLFFYRAPSLPVRLYFTILAEILKASIYVVSINNTYIPFRKVINMFSSFLFAF